MSDLVDVLEAIYFKLERLESHARCHEHALREFILNQGVVNRKVELIHDEIFAKHFYKEEEKEEKGRPGPTYQAVQSVSQADAKTPAA